MKVDRFEFPDECRYDPREHLWVRAAAGPGPVIATVGVDALGVEALGGVVHVQLAPPGQRVGRGEPLGSLEAEKMVRPVLAPLSGRILEVNGEVERAPRLLNDDPYGRGWLVRLEAHAWEREAEALLHGAEAVGAWARAELRALQERG